jgi:hypothetical protein
MDNRRYPPSSSGKFIVLSEEARPAPFHFHVNNGLIAQLLSIRDNDPQWRILHREEIVIAANAYTAQMKELSAPRLELVKL